MYSPLRYFFEFILMIEFILIRDTRVINLGQFERVKNLNAYDSGSEIKQNKIRKLINRHKYNTYLCVCLLANICGCLHVYTCVCVCVCTCVCLLVCLCL